MARKGNDTIDCYVKLPSGRTISFNLAPDDNLEKICLKVSEEEQVPADRVELKYQGKILKKSHTVGYLGVCKETILKAEIVKVKQLKIFVKLPSGKTVPVNIENVSPLRYIKDVIYAEEDIDPSRQILKISGRTLSNVNQRCIDAGITDECILTLEETPVKKVGMKKKMTSKLHRKGSYGSGSDDDMTDEEPNVATPETTVIDEDLKESVVNTFDAMGKNVEVAFCFDTTGSMYSCLVQVRNKLKETVTKLIQEIPNIRIAIMAQGDYCDYHNYVVKCEDFTNDVDTLTHFADHVEKTSGGDSPECYEWALRKAQHLDWAEDSAKAFVLIGDDVPHPPSYTDQNVSWHEEIDVLKGRGIKVYGVRAQHGTTATQFYQEISEHTGGAYIEFKNFAIITEMFLAVCYKEAGNEQFEQFCEEIEQNTEQQESVKEDVKKILKQIDEADSSKESKPKRYVSAAWWDHTKDVSSTPQYSYNANTDKWTRCSGSAIRKDDLPVDVHVDRPVSSASKHTDPSWKSRITRTFSLRRSARSSSARSSTTTSKESRKCIVM